MCQHQVFLKEVFSTQALSLLFSRTAERISKQERVCFQVQDYLNTSSKCPGGLAPESTVFLIPIISMSA